MTCEERNVLWVKHRETHSATRSVREECSDRVGERNKKEGAVCQTNAKTRQQICMEVTFSPAKPDIIPSAPSDSKL